LVFSLVMIEITILLKQQILKIKKKHPNKNLKELGLEKNFL